MSSSLSPKPGSPNYSSQNRKAYQVSRNQRQLVTPKTSQVSQTQQMTTETQQQYLSPNYYQNKQQQNELLKKIMNDSNRNCWEELNQNQHFQSLIPTISQSVSQFRKSMSSQDNDFTYAATQQNIVRQTKQQQEYDPYQVTTSASHKQNNKQRKQSQLSTNSVSKIPTIRKTTTLTAKQQKQGENQHEQSGTGSSAHQQTLKQKISNYMQTTNSNVKSSSSGAVKQSHLKKPTKIHTSSVSQATNANNTINKQRTQIGMGNQKRPSDQKYMKDSLVIPSSIHKEPQTTSKVNRAQQLSSSNLESPVIVNKQGYSSMKSTRNYQQTPMSSLSMSQKSINFNTNLNNISISHNTSMTNIQPAKETTYFQNIASKYASPKIGKQQTQRTNFMMAKTSVKKQTPAQRPRSRQDGYPSSGARLFNTVKKRDPSNLNEDSDELVYDIPEPQEFPMSCKKNTFCIENCSDDDIPKSQSRQVKKFQEQTPQINKYEVLHQLKQPNPKVVKKDNFFGTPNEKQEKYEMIGTQNLMLKQQVTPTSSSSSSALDTNHSHFQSKQPLIQQQKQINIVQPGINLFDASESAIETPRTENSDDQFINYQKQRAQQLHTQQQYRSPVPSQQQQQSLVPPPVNSTQIYKQAVKQQNVQQTKKSVMEQQILIIYQKSFEYLLQEEQILCNYIRLLDDAQFEQLKQSLPHKFPEENITYADCLERATGSNNQRPTLFANQLQLNLSVALSMISVFDQKHLFKYGQKLRKVITSVHQNFLLLIDLILNSCNANPNESLQYVQLRKITMKKLKYKDRINRLTQFRQNNEASRVTLKKIVVNLQQIDQKWQANLRQMIFQQNVASKIERDALLKFIQKINAQSIQLVKRLQEKEQLLIQQRQQQEEEAKKEAQQKIELQQQQKQNQVQIQTPRKDNSNKTDQKRQSQSESPFMLPETYAFLMGQSQALQSAQPSVPVVQFLDIPEDEQLNTHEELNSSFSSNVDDQNNISLQINQQVQEEEGPIRHKSLPNAILEAELAARDIREGEQTATNKNQLPLETNPFAQVEDQKSYSSLKEKTQKSQLSGSSSSDLCKLSNNSSSQEEQFEKNKSPQKQEQYESYNLTDQVDMRESLTKQPNQQSDQDMAEPFQMMSCEVVLTSAQQQPSKYQEQLSPCSSFRVIQSGPQLSSVNMEDKQSPQDQNQHQSYTTFCMAMDDNSDGQQDDDSDVESLKKEKQNDHDEDDLQIEVDIMQPNISEVAKTTKIQGSKLQEENDDEENKNRTDINYNSLFQNLIGNHLDKDELKKEMQRIKHMDEQVKLERRISMRESITCANGQGINLRVSQIAFGEFDEAQTGFDPKVDLELDQFKRQSEVTLQKYPKLDEVEQNLIQSAKKDQQYQFSTKKNQNFDINSGLDADDQLVYDEDINEGSSKDEQEVKPVKEFKTDDILYSSEEESNVQDTNTITDSLEQQTFNDSQVEQTDKDQTTTLDNNNDEDDIDKELQRLKEKVTIPYLPPFKHKKGAKKEVYTLVLDLDETLIHFFNEEDDEGDEDGFYMVRPGCMRFLKELSEYYEIVIFTAAMPDYADWIVNTIDTGNYVSHRLYRQHTSPHMDYAIKDLTNLGRDITKTIIIDNLADNFIYTTPSNGIWVESWYDDMDDNILELLIPFLKEIVTSKMPDVRVLLEPELKEKTLYKYLEQGTLIPLIDDILAQKVEKKDKNQTDKNDSGKKLSEKFLSSDEEHQQDNQLDTSDLLLY